MSAPKSLDSKEQRGSETPEDDVRPLTPSQLESLKGGAQPGPTPEVQPRPGERPGRR
jgi:hypothetical protein